MSFLALHQSSTCYLLGDLAAVCTLTLWSLARLVPFRGESAVDWPFCNLSRVMQGDSMTKGLQRLVRNICRVRTVR